MAPADRPTPQHLTFLQGAKEQVRRWHMFALARGAEARAPGQPRIGASSLGQQDIVRFGQLPSMSFPAPNVEEVNFPGMHGQIVGQWVSLLGPMGALPSHLTEFALYERRYAKSRPFGQWLDMLANRSLQFFYRAWANSQPVAEADRPNDDRFARYISYLTGAQEGVGDRAAWPAMARLQYAALFASNRSAVGIEDALSHLLGQDVHVQEFVPKWRDVDPEDQTRLGQDFCTLGNDIMAGKRVRLASDAFRVIVRARTMNDYRDLLPLGKRFALAAEALDSFAPSHLEWDMQVEIASKHIRPAKLDGHARLGWTSWMGSVGTKGVRRDVHLRRIMGRQKKVERAAA